MKTPKRSTVYLDPDLHRALRLKAAETDCSLSHLINEAVRKDLAEDALDLAAHRARKREKAVDLEPVFADLRRPSRR